MHRYGAVLGKAVAWVLALTKLCVRLWCESCQAHLHLDFVGLDAFVQRAHVVLWQVAAIIDAPVVAQEVLQVPHPCRVALSCMLEEAGCYASWDAGFTTQALTSSCHKDGAYASIFFSHRDGARASNIACCCICMSQGVGV